MIRITISLASMAAPQREWPSVPELDTTAQVDFIICCDLNGTVKSSDGTVKSHWTAECVWSTLSCCTCMQLALGSECRRWLRLCGDRGTGWLWVAPMSERGVNCAALARRPTRNLVPLGCHHARRVITIHISLYTMIQFWFIRAHSPAGQREMKHCHACRIYNRLYWHRYCIQPRSAPTAATLSDARPVGTVAAPTQLCTAGRLRRLTHRH